MPHHVKPLLPILLAVTALVVGSGRASAHHSFAAEFDINKPIELRGKVVKVELINPHSWIHIEVTNKDGARETWMVEGGSPNALFRKGITKDSIPVGTELVVIGYQARDGANRCVGRTLKLADGRSLFFYAAPLPSGAE
jgi:hypothetical protein